jgi:hypothetical protein
MHEDVKMKGFLPCRVKPVMKTLPCNWRENGGRYHTALSLPSFPAGYRRRIRGMKCHKDFVGRSYVS